MGFSATTYDEARAYLDKARDPYLGRPIANNTRLLHLDDTTVGIRLHSTIIVAWHSDNTQTINTAGWMTPTTLNRLRRYAHAKIQGLPRALKAPYGTSWGIYHDTDDHAPPRVQKCRRCHGKATVPDECWGSHRHCNGPEWCMVDRCYTWPLTESGTCEHGQAKAHYLDACPHGALEPHRLGVCKHGQNEGHKVGTCEHGHIQGHPLPDRPCYWCDGVGKRDYGSYQLPFVWDGGAVQVDPTGKVLGIGPEYKAKPAWLSGKPAKAKPKPPGIGGDQVLTELRRAVPNLMAKTACPACRNDEVCHPDDQVKHDLATVVIELNDTHRWTREAIADWLESLDLDLTFKTSAA